MCHVKKYSAIILKRVVFAAVRQFEYLENPGLSHELTPCLRTLHYYGHSVSTNMTRKNYFIIVVVQFS